MARISAKAIAFHGLVNGRPMAVLSVCAFPGTSFDATFKADRVWFFEKCAVVKNYEMSTDGLAAFAKGKTPLSKLMKAGLNHRFDSWEKFGDADVNRIRDHATCQPLYF